MKQVIHLLNILVKQSKEILGELNSESASLESVEEAMAQRKDTIGTLISLPPVQSRESLTQHEEEVAKNLFSTFEQLSKDINSTLTKAINESRETLASATKKRKADDKYRVISQPDITHF